MKSGNIIPRADMNQISFSDKNIPIVDPDNK